VHNSGRSAPWIVPKEDVKGRPNRRWNTRVLEAIAATSLGLGNRKDSL